MFDDIYTEQLSSGATKTERMNNSAEIRKKNSRKNSYKPVMIVCSAILFILIIAAMFFLRIKSVVIINDGIYDTEEIEQVANDGVYRHMFFPRSNSLKEKLEKEFPYLTLDTASFEKDFSTQTLTVTAVYIEPAYCIHRNSKYLILSIEGKILDAKADGPVKGLPIVSGVQITTAEAGTKADFARNGTDTAIKSLIEMLKEADIDNVSEIDMSDKNDIKVYLSDGGTILLGSASSINKTGTAFLKELYIRHKAEETNNLYVIELKNNKDGYIRVLDETLPEETETEETTKETAEETTEQQTEVPEETQAEQTEENDYESPLNKFDDTYHENTSEEEHTSETEATTAETEADDDNMSPLSQFD